MQGRDENLRNWVKGRGEDTWYALRHGPSERTFESGLGYALAAMSGVEMLQSG